MWELDCEEGWAPKNWCFWTVVLKKTLESPLDYKEIQPVHSKDQPWNFFANVLAFKLGFWAQFSPSVMCDCDPMDCSTPGLSSITNSQSLLKLTSIESVMPSSHLILCHPLLLLPPVPPSIRVFSNQSTLCMRWPKYWSFSFSIIPSKEHPGLISFRMDWLDLLAVHGTLKSLLQHHSSKAACIICAEMIKPD